MRAHAARSVRTHTSPPEFGSVEVCRPEGPWSIQLLTRGGGIQAADNTYSNMYIEEDQILLTGKMLKHDRDHPLKKHDTVLLQHVGGSWLLLDVVSLKHTFEGSATVKVESDDLHIVAPALGGTCSVDHHIIGKAPWYDEHENIIGWIPIYEDLPGPSTIPDE